MRALPFDTASLSQTGTRANNEDACCYREGCWVVADGLGGHGGGEVAARLAVEALLAAWDPAAPLTADGPDPGVGGSGGGHS
jgi:serine/threonine protein phosphatase PrpC